MRHAPNIKAIANSFHVTGDAAWRLTIGLGKRSRVSSGLPTGPLICLEILPSCRLAATERARPQPGGTLCGFGSVAFTEQEKGTEEQKADSGRTAQPLRRYDSTHRLPS